MSWQLAEAERAWLQDEGGRLLDFGARSVHPEGGFAWLDARGRPQLDRPVELWITARMTHCFALGRLLGHADSEDLVDHGVRALTGRLADDRHGGWYAASAADGPSDGHKETYGHAFVALAASSAVAAGHPDGGALLDRALSCFEQRLWSEDDGLVVDRWDEAFDRLDPYRGLNANMHSVEAFLAVTDVTGDLLWRERALRIVRRVLCDLAPQWQWRLPEHFDSAWTPLPDYNRDLPADPFRPYGATVGHGLEWARLALALEATLDEPPAWLADAALRLFDRAVTDGWAVDGRPGFVYTTDWEGRPVVRERMHWVVAEATATAASLGQRTGDPRFAAVYELWWDHIKEVFVDADGGSWWHELGPDNRPSQTVWSGKPDIYHALQVTLVPRLPLTASLAGGLRRGWLDTDRTGAVAH